MSEQPVFRPESKFCRIRIGRSLLFSRQETFAQRPQRGGVLLIPGLDATFAARGRPDWMAVTKDAVWVASSSVNHVVRLDAKTNQPGTIVTVAKPCAGLVVGFGSLWIPSCGDHTAVRVDAETGSESTAPQIALERHLEL